MLGLNLIEFEKPVVDHCLVLLRLLLPASACGDLPVVVAVVAHEDLSGGPQQHLRLVAGEVFRFPFQPSPAVRAGPRVP